MLYFKSVLMSEHITPQNHGKFRKNIYTPPRFNVKIMLQKYVNYYWLQINILTYLKIGCNKTLG